MTKTKVYSDKDKRQYRTTIPKVLAESSGLEGDKIIRWSITDNDELGLEVTDTKEGTTTKIYKDYKGKQYKITIPKNIVEEMGLKGGDFFVWSIIGREKFKVTTER